LGELILENNRSEKYEKKLHAFLPAMKKKLLNMIFESNKRIQFTGLQIHNLWYIFYP